MSMRRLLPALVAGAALAAPATAAAQSTTVVVSEIQFRGPAGGNDEFIELRNVSSTAQPIGGWRLQGCNAAGTIGDRATVPAGVSLPAGESYVFANTAGTVTGDTGYGTGISDNGGARLVDAGGAIVDQVGSVGGTPCIEGTGLTIPTANGQNAFERRGGGTQDTQDNAADFTGPQAGTPDPLEGGDPEPPEVTPIHELQGAGAASPLAGQNVVIEGVVTGVDDEIGANFERVFPGDAGIFVQERTPDADLSTSEGVFVGFVRPRAGYPPGTVVRLEGRVVEQFNETRVNLTQGTTPEVLATGAPVPPAVTIDPAAAAAQATPARPYYESLEGMNVRVGVGTATSGGRNKFGETFLTLGVNQDPEDRVFRTETVPELIAADSDAGAGDPDNPLVDTDSTTELPVDLFDVVRDLEGPLGFSFSHYKVLNQAGDPPVIEQGPTQYPYSRIQPRRADQLRVASFNVENFFPPGTELDLRIVTEEEYAEKRAQITHAIGDLLERPDVVAVQEVYDLASLQDLADELGGYSAYLEPGNDSRGIDVGFLIADGVEHSNVRQLGKTATGPAGFTCSDVSGGLYDRPPLAVDVEAGGVAFTIFSNHFSSKSAPDQCRAAQAAFLRDRVAEIEAAGGEAIVAGDLNAFEDESALTTLEDSATSLDNLWDVPPESERYSYHFDGKLQTLDHILVTDGLAERVDDFLYAHFDNDYYERRAAGDGHHLSDHDPPVLTLDVAAPPVNLVRPFILGEAKRKRLLVGVPGLWTADEGRIEYDLQWLRCADRSEESCAPIAGATSPLYVPGKADKGAYLRLQVTATSRGGSTTATSHPVGPVR